MDDPHPLDAARDLRLGTRLALAINVLYALPMLGFFLGFPPVIVSLVAWRRLGNADRATEGAVFTSVAGATSFGASAVILMAASVDMFIHGTHNGGVLPVRAFFQGIIDLYAVGGALLGAALIVLGRACSRAMDGTLEGRALWLLVRRDRWAQAGLVALVLLFVLPTVARVAAQRAARSVAVAPAPLAPVVVEDGGPPAPPCFAGSPPSVPVVAALSDVTVTFTPPPGFVEVATRGPRNENRAMTLERCDHTWFSLYAEPPFDAEGLQQIRCVHRARIVHDGPDHGFGLIIAHDEELTRMERDIALRITWSGRLDASLRDELLRTLRDATYKASPARVEWTTRLLGARITSIETGASANLCEGQRMLVHEPGPPPVERRGTWRLDMNGIGPTAPVPRLILDSGEMNDLRYDAATKTMSADHDRHYRVEPGVAPCHLLDEEDRRAPTRTLVLDASCSARWVTSGAPSPTGPAGR